VDPKAPIGVFDSGVGGLTVARALMERLPSENILYFGDTARVPYGIKSEETIAHYATEIAGFLLARGVKLLVLGCTHYPLLKPLLAGVAGAGVRLVDSAETVARETARLLAAHGLADPGPGAGAHQYFVTDVPQRFQRVGELFLGRPLAPVHVVKW
jgi:glutamate racemase